MVDCACRGALLESRVSGCQQCGYLSVDKEEETAFMTVFPIVLGFIIVFTVVIFVIARFIVPTPSEIAATVDSRVMMLVETRIEPVGKVRCIMKPGLPEVM